MKTAAPQQLFRSVVVPLVILIGMSANAAAQSCTASNFIVQYSSFIPVDHVDGPTFCPWVVDINNNGFIPMIYKGDANRGTYRTTEQIQVTLATGQSTGFFADDGVSTNYDSGGAVRQGCPPQGVSTHSPVNGTTISDSSPPLGDFDNIQKDCCLFNESKQSQGHLSYGKDVTFQSATHATVQFFGTGNNPLEVQVGGITWEITVNVHSDSLQAEVAFSHTCFPAHVVKVNGRQVYSYIPPRADLSYITSCLTPFPIGSGPVNGHTSLVDVPAY